MSRLARAWNRSPEVLAWSLLALQAAIPWSVTHYITQDGPSHLYTAIVTKDLLLHPHGLYAPVYQFQHRLVTNWSTPLLLGALLPIFGAGHAEAALATLCVLIGFACFTYFRGSIEKLLGDSSSLTCDPLTSFLLNSWFLWVGYYNFYLGIALCALLVGFYIRNSQNLNRTRAGLLGGGLLLLFFTHVLPAVLALMTIVLVAAWDFTRGSKLRWTPLLAALTPTAILLGFFVRAGVGSLDFRPDTAAAWGSFPQHVFAFARGRVTEEALLVPAMLFLLVTGMLAFERAEWLSVRLPLAGAALLSFGLYLFAPDNGFGGGGIKIRLAWAVFLFGCPVAVSGARMRALRTPVSLYIACFLAGSLIVTAHIVRRVGVAAEVYASALERIPEGSTLVREAYGAQSARERYGFDDIAFDPLIHADAWMASRRGLIDLTDYQALMRVFPITLTKEFTGTQQNLLYQMEGGESNGFRPLPGVLEDLPVRPEYVVLVGDEGSEAVRRSDFAKTRAWLDANWVQVSGTDFVRVYRRR